jgi:hypothetical protein
MSHKVTIKPRPLQTNHPIEIKMQAVKHISSFFKGGFPFNPLSQEQVKKWMPGLVNMDVTEKGFREAVEKYFIELSIPIPYAGKEIEVGLDSYGNPINLEEYIMYLFASGYSKVAKNKQQFDTDAMFDFYIDDPKDMAAARERTYNSSMKAALLLAELDKNDEKAAHVLAVLNPGLIVHNMTAKDIKMELADLMRVDPDKFVSVASAHNLENYAFINTLTSAGILSKAGDTFIYQDIALGNTLDQVVSFLKNPVNSAVVVQMKAKLEQIVISTKPASTEEDNPIEDEHTKNAPAAAPAAKASSK